MISIASRIVQAILSGATTVAGTFAPDADGTRDLGGAALRWASIFGQVLKDAGSITRLSFGNATTANIYTGNVANSGTNTTHSFRANTSLTASARIVDFHNDSAAATPEAYIDASGTINSLSGGYRCSNTNSVTMIGTDADDANAIGVILNNTTALTNAAGRLASFQNNSTEKLAVGKDGKFIFPSSGAADVQGTATLVGGTVTVNTSAVQTGDKIFTARNTTGGTAGHLNAPVASIVNGTSFVINSSSGTDTSTVNWWIIK